MKKNLITSIILACFILSLMVLGTVGCGGSGSWTVNGGGPTPPVTTGTLKTILGFGGRVMRADTYEFIVRVFGSGDDITQTLTYPNIEANFTNLHLGPHTIQVTTKKNGEIVGFRTYDYQQDDSETKTIQTAVQIKADGFVPEYITIKKGDRLFWINDDRIRHTLIGANPPFVPATINPGKGKAYAFPDAGTYTYYLDSGEGPAGIVYVTDAQITAISPLTGDVGDAVTLTGTNFDTTQGDKQVYFTGLEEEPPEVSPSRAASVPAPILSWSSTRIVCTVPLGAVYGPVGLTIPVGGETVRSTYPDDYFVPYPYISTYGPVQDYFDNEEITIEGYNFGPFQGNSTLTFGGVPAYIEDWSDTAIYCYVPWNAVTGNLVITTAAGPSKPKPFTVLNPRIDNLNPSTGNPGEAVTVTGSGFGSGPATVSGGRWSDGLYFNYASASITSWTDTQIVCTVPDGASTGPVWVTVNGYESNDDKTFTLSGSPFISSVSPNHGNAGDSVTINGFNFGTQAIRQGSQVTFDGYSAECTSWSETQIICAAPDIGDPEEPWYSGVQVETESGYSNEVPFTYNPVITGIRCEEGTGYVGGRFFLRGLYFGESGLVTFNGIPATEIWCWSSNFVVGRIPEGASTGPVIVKSGGYSSNSYHFILLPGLTELVPNYGYVGDQVVLNGNNFGSTRNPSTVLFSGEEGYLEAPIVLWSSTRIVCTVPEGAVSGRVKVSTDNGDSRRRDFTVLGAHLSSLEPSTGTFHDAVTVLGYGFGDTQGTSTITFNGTQATAESWSDTMIVCYVPSGATTGNVVVTIIDPETEEPGPSNGLLFTMAGAPVINSISPLYGNAGTPVTILGSNFGGAQNRLGGSTITFNGVSAGNATSWTNTAIIVPAPETGDTGAVVVTVDGPSNADKIFTYKPVINNLSPDHGIIGSSFTVNGGHFGTVGTMQLNGMAIVPSSWNNTAIVAVVPANATSGSVVLNPGTENQSNTKTFTVHPFISSLTPDNGYVGDTVTISGFNFIATPAVSFNGTAATVSSWNETRIYCSVPSGASTGPVVVTCGSNASAGVNFTVYNPPSITGILPSGAHNIGDTITITGTNFRDTGMVAFPGVGQTSATSWSNTQILAVIPNGTVTGQLNVITHDQWSQPANLSILPHITTLNPSSGYAGQLITITGSNFGGNGGSVTFNGTVADQEIWSATMITCTVPAGATTGNVVVTNSLGASNGVNFTVTFLPHIDSLNPDHGLEGSTVTIAGSNFGTPVGSPARNGYGITFGGVAVTNISSWTASQIICTVPSGASSGNVIVTTSVGPSNGVSFTVDLPMPHINSLNPNIGHVGTSVTISGTNFGAGPSGFRVESYYVSFNGVVATAGYTWTNTQIICAVPAGATTGNVVVTNPNGSSNGVNFTVGDAPTISTLTPTVVLIGSTVIVQGTNFGSTQGTNTVSFGSTTATEIATWSDTQIICKVPAGAVTGSAKVTNGFGDSNLVSYTIYTTGVKGHMKKSGGAVLDVMATMTYTMGGIAGGYPAYSNPTDGSFALPLAADDYGHIDVVATGYLSNFAEGYTPASGTVRNLADWTMITSGTTSPFSLEE